MAKQTSPHPKISPPSSNGGADKAVAALGGGILAAGLGGGLFGVVLGCLAGLGIGTMAEKSEKERLSRND